MFWENFLFLCNERGISPNGVCAELNLSNATATKWKNGAVPRASTLKRVADYFGVTTDKLLRTDSVNIQFDLQTFAEDSEKEKQPSPLDEEEDELTELLQELKTRPEMKMLFSLAKGATKEDVELAVQIIERMRRNSGDGD